jgi:glucose-1-phosphate adenylyltransferase
MESYFKTNMELLDMANCDDLFNAERPIYTKVRDDMPAIYGLGSDVKNSLVADGCII